MNNFTTFVLAYAAAVTNSHLFQNLQSPTGSFKLQFWVYVPTLFISDTIKNVASQNADKSDLIYIHIVSRLPEASDANQIALLERSDLKTIKCLPSVFLCIDISAGSFHLNVSASSGGDNKPKTGAITVNSLPAATLFAEINSKCLPCDRWLKCAVELFEEDEELLFTERDKYSLELLVNDERHGIINGIFRRY